MKTVFDHIRDHLLERCHYACRVTVQRLPDLELLRKTEWCPEFEQLMRNRLLMGAFRYGLMADKGAGVWDLLGSIERRLEIYRTTGNQETLVDIANLLMLEFVYPSLPFAHWQSVDDGEHVAKRSESIEEIGK